MTKKKKKEFWLLYEYEPNTYTIIRRNWSQSYLRFLFWCQYTDDDVSRMIVIKGERCGNWFRRGYKQYPAKKYFASQKPTNTNGINRRAQTYKIPKHRHAVIKSIVKYNLPGGYFHLTDRGEYHRISKSWKDQTKKKRQWMRE